MSWEQIELWFLPSVSRSRSLYPCLNFAPPLLCTVSVKGSYEFSRLCTMLTFLCERKKKKTLKIAATQHCLSFDFFRLVNMTLWTLSAKWLSSELNKHTNKSNNDQTYLSWRYWPSPPGLPKPVDLVPSSGRPLLPRSLAWIFPPLPPTPLPHGHLLLLQISAHWSLLPKSLAWSEHFIQGFPHPASSACFLHNNLSKLSGDWGRKKNPIVQNHALRKWVTWV